MYVTIAKPYRFIYSSPVTYVDRIAYDAKGQQILVAYGNGIMTRFLYREDNFRLLRLKSEKYTKSGLTYTPNSGVKQNYSYTYDLSGNIINITDTTPNCGYGATPDVLSRDFIYDALYRLLSATGRETAATGTTPWEDLYRPENESLARGYTQQYSYDKLGNIQELQHIATSGNFTRSFDYGAFTKNALNKITIGSKEYNFLYDINGNTTTEGDTARHMEYDCADRLRCFYVQTPSAEPSKYTHYLYDGAGNRVKKITRRQGGKYTATTYIDGAFEYTKESTGFDGIPNLKIGTWVIGSYSSGGEQNILHIMGGATRRLGAALGDTTPAIKYNLDDHLGSSCVQLDTNGTTLSLEEYYPFGETSFGSYAKKRYRFCGKEKDEESGLYYYGMRYYSAWTCRFINVDPLAGKFPFYTPYQYAGNKPINNIDLDGGEEKPNDTTNSGNNNLESYQTPGNGTVNLPSDVDPAFAAEGTFGTTDKGEKVPILAGSVTSFEVNNVRYDASFIKMDGAWQFDGYRDEHKNTYPNPQTGTDASTSPKTNIDFPSENTTAYGKTNPYYKNLHVGSPDSYQTYLNPQTLSQSQIDYFHEKALTLEAISFLENKPFLSAFAAIMYYEEGMNDEMWSCLSTSAFEIATLELGSSVKLGNLVAAKTGSSWVYGAFKTEAKWAGQLSKRGWTAEQITEAVTKGKTFDAVNMVNKANSATRYVHPTTGQSVVIDNVTKELLHVGGPGFKY